MRLLLLYKNPTFAHADFMKIKIYEQDGRSRDERENRTPKLAPKGEKEGGMY